MHRDIKPANILMEATGTGRPHLRLSDFGISMRKGEPRLTETNYVVGTPGYFAPEQMMGAEPDFPADLFAVGLVALYLIQGQKPDSQALVEHFAAHGTPSAPDGIPEPLWQVLAGLLQPDPHARFRTATGARKALTAAVEMLPEPGPDDEPVEVFDQIGPLPPGFGPDGPVTAPQQPGEPAPAAAAGPARQTAPGSGLQPSAPPPTSMSETGSFHLAPPPEASTPQQQPHQQPGFQQPPAAPFTADAPPRTPSARRISPRRRPPTCRAIPSPPAPTPPSSGRPRCRPRRCSTPRPTRPGAGRVRDRPRRWRSRYWWWR